MLGENELRTLPDPLVALFQKLERDTVDRICKRLGKIGELTETSVHELDALRRIGLDINAIERDIASTLNVSEAAVRDLFMFAAESDHDDAKALYDALGKPWTPFAENAALVSMVDDIAAVTFGGIVNMSRTTGFTNRLGAWEELAKSYQNIVDYAVVQVRSGNTDFHSAMRGAVKQLSDNGLSFIEYDNEGKRYYRRRLDSSVRNAFMGGQQRLSRAQAEALGQQLGADGMEISWHSGARPSHVDFAGKQYTMLDFERICVPLLNDYNCYHRAFSIILGVSPPTHTKSELAALNAKDAEKHLFEGREYNAYEARQMQRQFETAMRREKDRAVAFAKTGDKDAERIAKAKVTALNQKYKQFSKAVDLPPDPVRAAVPRYTRGMSINDILTLEKTTGLSYTNLATGYAKAVNTGDISPFVGFDGYTKTAQRVYSELVGITAADGTVIEGYKTHFVDRIVGQVGADSPPIKGKRRGVTVEQVRDTLLSPVVVYPSKTDSRGRISKRFNGSECMVTIKPDDGALIQTNPK